MRAFAVCAVVLAVLLLAPAAPARAQTPPGWDKGRKTGWDGDVPPGWEKKTPAEREEHDAIVVRYCHDVEAHVAVCIEANPSLKIRADFGTDLFRRSVNAGLTVEASFDLVKVCVSEDLTPDEAVVVIKTTATECHGKEIDHKNFGQWVASQVRAGKRGDGLVVVIKGEASDRHAKAKVKVTGDGVKVKVGPGGGNGGGGGNGKGSGGGGGGKGKGKGKGKK